MLVGPAAALTATITAIATVAAGVAAALAVLATGPVIIAGAAVGVSTVVAIAAIGGAGTVFGIGAVLTHTVAKFEHRIAEVSSSRVAKAWVYDEFNALCAHAYANGGVKRLVSLSTVDSRVAAAALSGICDIMPYPQGLIPNTPYLTPGNATPGERVKKIFEDIRPLRSTERCTRTVFLDYLRGSVVPDECYAIYVMASVRSVSLPVSMYAGLSADKRQMRDDLLLLNNMYSEGRYRCEFATGTSGVCRVCKLDVTGTIGRAVSPGGTLTTQVRYECDCPRFKGIYLRDTGASVGARMCEQKQGSVGFTRRIDNKLHTVMPSELTTAVATRFATVTAMSPICGLDAQISADNAASSFCGTSDVVPPERLFSLLVDQV